MLKKTITYKDYNDVERTEDFYFNLTKAEIAEMELSVSGGFAEMIDRIVSTKDTPALAKIFKEFIKKAYGVKSPDGRRFIKSEELTTEFTQTEAYSQLYMELATDDLKAVQFIEGIIPGDVREKFIENRKAIAQNN